MAPKQKGKHAFKFIVDDEWRFAPDQPTVADIEGRVNNFIDVSDFVGYTGEETFEANRMRVRLEDGVGRCVISRVPHGDRRVCLTSGRRFCWEGMGHRYRLSGPLMNEQPVRCGLTDVIQDSDHFDHAFGLAFHVRNGVSSPGAGMGIFSGVKGNDQHRSCPRGELYRNLGGVFTRSSAPRPGKCISISFSLQI